ncbi:MAG: DsrE family protein [Pseudomonadota bacterium]
MLRVISITGFVVIALSSSASAGPNGFSTGPRISEFGPAAKVVDATDIPASAVFKIAFDVADAAPAGERNRQLESVARLLNMHAKAGLAPERTHAAVVVHGSAAMDLVSDARYGSENASAGLIAALIEAGVSIQLCGQTAAFRGIVADDLLPGVTMSLSAMTAHAMLQQDGFTLNPF